MNAKIYKIISYLILPLLPLYLSYRCLKRKDKWSRFKERFGYHTKVRKSGELIWFHAASVGELRSVLPLIKKLERDYHILITTMTINSYKIFKTANLKNSKHQFLPYDCIPSIKRFLSYWKPEAALFVDSEIWPNFLPELKRRGIPLIGINSRLSDKSFKFWKSNLAFAKSLYSCFSLILAASETDKKKIANFYTKKIKCFGNLKLSSVQSDYDIENFNSLKKAIGNKLVIIAASTHPNEEEIVYSAFKKIHKIHTNTLLISAPRHPNRGLELYGLTQKLEIKSGLRTKSKTIDAEHEIYIADTIGEMGLWYRLSEIVFVGGSLVDRGGQNILEPAALDNAIIVGPYTSNFKDIVDSFSKSQALISVKDEATLIDAFTKLIENSELRDSYQNKALKEVARHGKVLENYLEEIHKILD